MQQTGIHRWRFRHSAVAGHQPAVRCKRICTVEEAVIIEDAILGQRVGMTAAQVAVIRDRLSSQNGSSSNSNDQCIKSKLRWTKLDMQVPARWKSCTIASNTQATEAGQAQHSPASRMIACTNCGSFRETAHMQLRTRQGYRDLTCPTCQFHGRVGRAKCICGTLWHQCNVHRVDPNTHRSAKARVIRHNEPDRIERRLPSTRPAPESRDTARASGKRRVERVLHQHGEFALAGARSVRLRRELNPILAARFPHLVG